MKMYYPSKDNQDHDRGLDVFALRESLLLCIGLFSLLYLQYNREGHLDEHVYDLFASRMMAIELELSNALGLQGVENIPF